MAFDKVLPVIFVDRRTPHSQIPQRMRTPLAGTSILLSFWQATRGFSR